MLRFLRYLPLVLAGFRWLRNRRQPTPVPVAPQRRSWARGGALQR